MKLFLFLFIIVSTLPASAQSNTISWNKVLTGTIGNYPATMYLQKTGKEYNGYYYYDNKQIPMRLTNGDSNEDSVHISAYENDNAEYFDGTINSGLFKGVWKNVLVEKITALNFSFTENMAALPPFFDVIFTEYFTDYPVGLEKGSNPNFTYFSAALWPVSATPAALGSFLKKWVNNQFGNKTAGLTIGKFFVNEKNKSVADWRKDLGTFKKSELKEFPSGSSLSTERRQLIMYQNAQYISLADFSYEFTGGAHGNGGSSMQVLDIKKLKVLNLLDIVTVTGKQRLATLLDAAVRAKFNIAKGAKLNSEDGGELLVSKITPNENFYITGKGIGFNYMPYEIAAYAYGEVNLFIPFGKLKGLLQPGFGQ